MQEKPGLHETLALMKDLRKRCEWDAAQTHESLRPYLLEEAYEVDDAIRAGNDLLLREELGDLLLQVLFHSVVAEERGAFDFGDVAEGFLHKMKSRHPHLYEGGERQSWEGMKARKRASIVDGLPADLRDFMEKARRLPSELSTRMRDLTMITTSCVAALPSTSPIIVAGNVRISRLPTGPVPGTVALAVQALLSQNQIGIELVALWLA